MLVLVRTWVQIKSCTSYYCVYCRTLNMRVLLGLLREAGWPMPGIIGVKRHDTYALGFRNTGPRGIPARSEKHFFFRTSGHDPRVTIVTLR